MTTDTATPVARRNLEDIPDTPILHTPVAPPLVTTAAETGARTSLLEYRPQPDEAIDNAGLTLAQRRWLEEYLQDMAGGNRGAPYHVGLMQEIIAIYDDREINMLEQMSRIGAVLEGARDRSTPDPAEDSQGAIHNVAEMSGMSTTVRSPGMAGNTGGE